MNLGVKYTGTFQCATGYGSANRAFVTAMHVAGVDVVTDLVVQTMDRTTFGWEGMLCHHLTNRSIDYKIKIIHLTPDLYKEYIEPGKYHIGHLFWETDRLPHEWIEACNQMQEIWTSSENMARVFRANGVTVPIHWFPQPIDVSIAEKNYGEYAVNNHSGFLFYSIFQWIERKNPQALIRAFWEVFEGKDDVSLLIKTFRLSYDYQEFEKIRDDIRLWRAIQPQKHYPKLLLVSKIMNQEEIMKIHETGDCYVQADRGEGWSRTVQEALLKGNPTIATARGGIHEYLKSEHYFGIPNTYVPVKEIPWVKFYKADQRWAEIDKDSLKKAMMYVYSNSKIAGTKGIVGQHFIKEQFSYQKIGELMKKRIEEIYKLL